MINHSVTVTGPLGVNTALVYSETTLLVIDPGADITGIIDRTAPRDSVFILLTHGHIDHVAGVSPIVKKYPNTKIYIHDKDMPLLHMLDYQADYLGFEQPLPFKPDNIFSRDGVIDAGDIPIRHMHMGGHTAGSTAFLIDGVVYSGDTLFNFVLGRTDLMGSTSHGELVEQIRAKLLCLPDDTRVIPGHGPETTIGFERHNNLYLRTRDND